MKATTTEEQTFKPQERPAWLRWWVLALLCIVIYSFVYCYDNPFAIQNQLIDEYGLTEIQYNLLYGVYGYVNFVAPFVAGLLIDCVGIHSSTVLFYIFIVAGHSLWIIGCFKNVSSFGLMITGRAIFGVGAEQFHTSRKWLLYDYFTELEYYFASGLSLSASRLGSASQSYISAHLYDKSGIVAVLSVGWCLTVFSLILIIVSLLVLKRYNKRHRYKQPNLSVSLSNIDPAEKQKIVAVPAETDALNEGTALKEEGTSNADENAKDVSNGAVKKEKQLPDEDDAEDEESFSEGKFNLVGLCRGGHDRRWWELGLTLIFFYSTYLSYSNVGSAFLQNRYQYSYETSNSLAPITFWISAVGTPIFGFLCDYYGKRCIFMLAAAVSLFLGHMFLGFIGSYGSPMAVPVVGLVLLGSGYSLGAAAIWPSFGLIVEQRYLATTLGIWGSIDNCFQATCSVIVGALTQEYSKEERAVYYDQYDDARYFWLALAICTLVSTLVLWYSDARQFDNVLWHPQEIWLKKRQENAAQDKCVAVCDMNCLSCF